VTSEIYKNWHCFQLIRFEVIGEQERQAALYDSFACFQLIRFEVIGELQQHGRSPDGQQSPLFPTNPI